MGIFDRFYYGKAGQRDYTEMDMPKNRVALFFLVLKDHFFDLVKVNLMQIVFWIPFIVWSLLNLIAIQTIDVEALMAQENAEASLLSVMSGYMIMWLIGLIPCILLTGPSSAGSAYIMRNWARDQHAFLFSDFKDAFKGNWKQALGVALMTGIVPFVAYTAVLYYSQMANGNLVMYVPLVLVLFATLMWCLMLPLLYAMMIGYELSFKNLIKNAFLMAAASLPKMAVCRVITLIPIVLLIAGVYLGNMILILVMVVYYLFFGFAFSKLVYASFANGVFDRYLNPHIEGAQVGMGLRPQDAEDYLDDEDDEEEDDEE